jgi:hypothetical protein
MRTYLELNRLIQTGRCKQYEDHALPSAQTSAINQAISTAKDVKMADAMMVALYRRFPGHRQWTDEHVKGRRAAVSRALSDCLRAQNLSLMSKNYWKACG